MLGVLLSVVITERMNRITVNEVRRSSMKLFLNKTSPFARAIRILIIEKGLEDKVELCWSDPWEDEEELLSVNPLGRVPTLVTDTQVPICETLLIVQHLNSISSSTPLRSEKQLEEALHLAGLGQGIMEAAFALVVSKKYLSKEANRSVLTKRRGVAIKRTLKQLNSSISHASIDELDFGSVILAVALEYLRFRLPELYIESGYPALELWRLPITGRHSFKNTAFE